MEIIGHHKKGFRLVELARFFVAIKLIYGVKNLFLYTRRGCQNVLLNELTAKTTGRKVITGPVEATATGNILAQMIAGGALKDLADGRKLVANSFDIEEIEG